MDSPGRRTLEKSRSIGLAIAFTILAASGLQSAGFDPDPDGWIRHWVVYGPIGTMDPELGIHPVQVHPFTGEAFVLIDAIAEADGKDGRRTELNFLPAPGREIDTAFGTLYPMHALRREASPRINPNSKPMGIGWADCECVMDFYDVLGMDPYADIRDILIYAYAYANNITGKPLEVFISLAQEDGVHVLLGHVPDKEGADFMRSVFVNPNANEWKPYCAELQGPAPDPGLERTVVIQETVTLEPGLNLLLAKVVNINWGSSLSFRFRHNDPPNYTPVTGEEIKIQLTPDLGAPDPVLFLRMDSDGDGRVSLSDAVRTAMWLFLGADPIDCPDAADADDNGKLDLSDAVYTLGHLFLGGDPPAFPRGCPGLDPTEDDLPDCGPGGR